MIIKRKELYKRVWATPMVQLAADYGLSDVGLKKICKKLNVPTPPRGYWVKLQNGYKVSQTPLPEKNKNEPDTYTLHHDLNRRKLIKNKIIEEKYVPDGIDLTEPIAVSKRLSNPHPFVKHLKKLCEKQKPDEYGVIQPNKPNYFSIRVSPNNLARAIRILDCIVKWFEANGFHFSFKNDSETYLQIFDERIQFAIHEKVKRIDHKHTQKELEDIARASWLGPHKWDYIPTGKLYIFIDTWSVHGIRRKWSDTKTKRLEELINNFIAGSFKVSYFLRQVRLKREEENRIRREEQARFAEKARLREMERQSQINLENQAVQWEKCCQIRNFIKEVEARSFKIECSAENSEKIKKWISWANDYADSLDPLHDNHLLEFFDSYQT